MKRSRGKSEDLSKASSPSSEAGTKRKKNDVFTARELLASDGYVLSEMKPVTI